MLTQDQNRLLTQVSPGTPMGDLFSRFWLPALLSEEIPSAGSPPVRVTLLGRRLVAFRDSEGRVGLFDARCPHRSVDLFFGRNEGDGLRCVYHGWKFDVTGRCLEMPSEPAGTRMKDSVRATSFPVVEKAGIVWAYLGPQHDVPDVPDLELMALPSTHVYASKRLMRCNYMQALEGSLDTSHMTFLHRAMQPMEKDVFAVGALQKFSDDDGAPVFFCKETPYGLSISARRDGDGDTFYWRVTQFLLPVGVLVPTAAGLVCRANFFVPIDDENCWWYRIRYNPVRPLSGDEMNEYVHGDLDYSRRKPGTYESEGSRENDYLIDREEQQLRSFTGIRSAQLQDIAVQESQGIVVDRSIEHLGTSDTAIVMSRRRLMNAALELQQGRKPPVLEDSSEFRVRAVAITLRRELSAEDAAAHPDVHPA